MDSQRDSKSDRISRAAASLGLLGAGPDGAHRLLVALCNPKLDMREIVALVTRDPGLAARVLKVANSSFYGRAGDVDTVERAVIVLGLDAVRGVAASACLDRVLPAGPSSPLPDMTALVRHSVATGFAAEQLAESSQPDFAAEAFIAGLLHDLGVVIQARLEPESFRRMTEALRKDPQQEVIAVEASCMQVTQEECARVIFESWQLPPALRSAAQYHHQPWRQRDVNTAFTQVVHVANHLALLAGYTFSGEPGASTLDPASASVAGLTDTGIEALAQKLRVKVQAFFS